MSIFAFIISYIFSWMSNILRWLSSFPFMISGNPNWARHLSKSKPPCLCWPYVLYLDCSWCILANSDVSSPIKERNVRKENTSEGNLFTGTLQNRTFHRTDFIETFLSILQAVQWQKTRLAYCHLKKFLVTKFRCLTFQSLFWTC